VISEVPAHHERIEYEKKRGTKSDRGAPIKHFEAAAFVMGKRRIRILGGESHEEDAGGAHAEGRDDAVGDQIRPLAQVPIEADRYAACGLVETLGAKCDDEDPLRPRYAPVDGPALRKVNAEKHHADRPAGGSEFAERHRSWADTERPSARIDFRRPHQLAQPQQNP